MKKYLHPTTQSLFLAFAIVVTACGANPSPAANPTQAPTITSTPDPCAPENLEAAVFKIHNHMREFDDASSLASGILQGIVNGQMQMGDLSNVIPDLQRIRRETEDQPAPVCLVNLKTFLLSHMNAVLNSLSAFLSSNQQAFDQNVVLARQQRDQYLLELARLLGQTVPPVTIIPPPASETPSP